jgi:uncharacterized protein YndB with AHSA1/START domain
MLIGKVRGNQEMSSQQSQDRKGHYRFPFHPTQDPNIMIRKTVIIIAILVAALLVIIATRPPVFRLERSTVIAAPPEQVFGHINDFHKWEAWSPWAKLDPNSKTTFEGPPNGKGAIFKWAGNNEVGEGRQEIIESEAPQRIVIRLEFIKPFKALNQTEFTLKPEAGGTQVTWAMSGKNNFMAKAVSLFMDCEKMVGPDFEKGLASLKTISEAKP